MIQGIKNVCRAGLRIHAQVQSRYSSTTPATIKSEWKKRRNIIFDNELKRQEGEIGRIEKIVVKYQPQDPDDEGKQLAMNKNLSTPNDCVRHISEHLHKAAALALVDGQPWDMHKPFVNDCEIQFLTMQMPKDSPALNPAFWRTCSLMLGSMIENSFKDEIQMYLHSFPKPNIRSGSFTCDVVLDLPDWKPTAAELRAMSAVFVKLSNAELPVERLEITEELALDMFQDNPFKSKQIPSIARSNDDKVTLYRVGDHIDMSKGPMVGHTGIIGRATVSAVYKIESEETDRLYRFQGVAVPRGVMINHFAFGLLEERARKLNSSAWAPQKLVPDEVIEEEHEESTFAAKN